MTNEVLAKRIAELERQLSDERMKNSHLEKNLNSKTEIANQLKDSLSESFVRELTLKSERDALAAQVGMLTKTVIETKAAYEEFSLFVWERFVLEITNSARVCNRRQTYEMLDGKFQSIIPDEYVPSTPQQCLVEIRIEAVKEFVAFLPAYSYNLNAELEKKANEYAIKLKGEMK